MFQTVRTIVLKVTRDCNLRCDYCYLREEKDKYHKEVMDYDLFKKIIQRIIQDKLVSNDLRNVEIIFHGGEPTIIGYDRLYKMFDYIQTEFSAAGMATSYRLSIQTNLTLVDEKMAQMFRKFNVSVGISFDGVGKANSLRTKTNKTDSFYKKYKMLQKYSLGNGCLMVATKQNIKSIKKTNKYLSKKFNMESAKINYVEDVINKNSTIEISPDEYIDNVVIPNLNLFLKAKNGKYFQESCISMTLEKYCQSKLFNVEGFGRTNCYTKLCGSSVSVIEIDPNGALSFCGRYTKLHPETYLEHVLDSDFLELQKIKKYLGFSKIKQRKLLEYNCDNCIADRICDHGCMAFHFEKYGEFGIREDLVCGIFKKQVELFEKNENKIIEKYIELYILPRFKNNKKINLQITSIIHSLNSNYKKYFDKYGISVSINNNIVELTLNKKITIKE